MGKTVYAARHLLHGCGPRGPPAISLPDQPDDAARACCALGSPSTYGSRVSSQPEPEDSLQDIEWSRGRMSSKVPSQRVPRTQHVLKGDSGKGVKSRQALRRRHKLSCP